MRYCARRRQFDGLLTVLEGGGGLSVGSRVRRQIPFTGGGIQRFPSWTDGGDEAGNRSDEPDEAGEA